MNPCDTCPARFECLRLSDNQPTQEDEIVDGVFTKRITITHAGTIVPQHSHEYEHLTVVASGSVLATEGSNPPNVVHAPNTIRIPANTKHTFTSLEPATILLCVHHMPPVVNAEHQIIGQNTCQSEPPQP